VFENVVVGITSSSVATRVVRCATELAGSSGGTVHIVASVDVHQAPEAKGVDGPGSRGEWIDDADLEDGLLDHLREMAVAAQVPVSVHSVSAEPDALFRVASQTDADLIVVGRRTKAGDRPLSELPRALLDQSPCAVLVV
jgi:nucleotide-binding universal stress UspA family protein